MKQKPYPHIEAALFDMDGLLLDTEIIYTQVTQAIVGEFGKVFDWSVKGNMIGRPEMDSANYLVEALDLPISAQDYLDQRNTLLRQAFPDAAALPGAEILIRHLSAHGVPIAIATSSSKEMFDLKASKRHSWFKLFNAVVTSDHIAVKKGKPAPDLFNVAAAEIGATTPDNTLVFEDAPSGLAAAMAAGMPTVVVPDVNMDNSRYQDANLILDSLLNFAPELFGLPQF
jgi:pseudouridine-5'-monophosphatase